MGVSDDSSESLSKMAGATDATATTTANTTRSLTTIVREQGAGTEGAGTEGAGTEGAVHPRRGTCTTVEDCVCLTLKHSCLTLKHRGLRLFDTQAWRTAFV